MIMKNMFAFATAVSILAVACTSAPEADTAATGEAQAAGAATGTTFNLDSASTIGWIGTKVGGQHNGTFNITSGSFTVDSGNITAGTINIDMKSAVVLDLTGDDKNNLEGHLKSGDFFMVDSFPTASFEITGSSAFDSTTATSKLAGATHTINGNLTLRGQTKSVSFPAIVKVEGNSLTAQADFNIDRTNWGLSYKGPNNPADWFIAKEVNLKLNLKASAVAQ
jgi:polyisoprenoid-binding protein YceI